MQPVLARARKMLLGQEAANPIDLQLTANQVERDPLAFETYIESEAVANDDGTVGVGRAQIESALSTLIEDLGFRVRFESARESYALSGPNIPRTLLSSKLEAIERDRRVLPLSPFHPLIRKLADALTRPGERLPLVFGCHEHGGFRVSVANWVDSKEVVPVHSLKELEYRLGAWDGTCPAPEKWHEVLKAAQVEANEFRRLAEEQAIDLERKMVTRQTEAARLRLMRELGRYLTCIGLGTGDLNAVLFQQMSRDIASAERLKRCLDKLGGYPEWSTSLRRELLNFVDQLSDNQRKARLIGSEIDAALQDPRWVAVAPQS